MIKALQVVYEQHFPLSAVVVITLAVVVIFLYTLVLEKNRQKNPHLVRRLGG